MSSSRPAESLLRAVASGRLTLAVLLGFAALAAVGTLLSQPPAETAHGVPFALIVALGILNIAVCTWRRSAARWRTAGARRRLAVDAPLYGSLLLVIAGGAAKALFGFAGAFWAGTILLSAATIALLMMKRRHPAEELHGGGAERAPG